MAVNRYLLYLFSCLLAAVPVSAADAPVAATKPAQDPTVYVNFGMEKGSRGDWPGAIDAFTEAIKIDPNWAPAYEHRGFALFVQNKFTEAIADFNKTLQIDSSYQDAYYHRGLAEGGLIQFNAAIADFSRLIELNPKYTNAYLARGMARYFNNDFDGTQADAGQALANDSRLTTAYFYRGLARRNKNDPTGAADDFAKSADSGFSYGAFWYWIVKNESGEEGSAREKISEYLSRYGSSQEPWEKSMSDFLLQRLDEKQLLERGRKEDPVTGHLGEAWFFIGVARRTSGDQKGAREAFQQAQATGARQSVEVAEAPRELAKLPNP